VSEISEEQWSEFTQAVNLHELLALRYSRAHGFSEVLTATYVRYIVKLNDVAVMDALVSNDSEFIKKYFDLQYARLLNRIQFIQSEAKRVIYDPNRQTRVYEGLRHRFESMA
jgi:hypothetical protein